MNWFRAGAIAVSFVLFLSFIITGDKGINAYLEVKEKVALKELEIAHLKNQENKLKCELEEWNNEKKFYLEKAAREELLLGMPQEKVYIVKKD